MDKSFLIDRDALLCPVAQQGHLEIIKFLVEHGANVNAKGRWDETPIHKSAEQGHHEIVKFLVEHGADVNAKSEKKILGLFALADFLQDLWDATPLY
ncbi:hypothetical protein H0H87_000480 [Tephrocybe sp. NHM501043]|nr:hypothetical protein H0H87_000480 [Tephrocybe sp. NHM501043]